MEFSITPNARLFIVYGGFFLTPPVQTEGNDLRGQNVKYILYNINYFHCILTISVQ